MSYIYIVLTILLTVYGQCVIKWQVMQAGAFPGTAPEKIWFLATLLLNGWVLSGLFSAFLGSLTWMAAMTKFPLGHAYPFVGLSFVLVVLLGSLFFNETITSLKIIGLSLILLGVAIAGRG